MGRPAGRFTGGSRSDQILAALAQGPLTRRRIVVKTQIDARPLGIALARLIKQRKVVVDAEGLHHVGAAPIVAQAPVPTEDESATPEKLTQPVPQHLRRLVEACIRRAHDYRAQGRREDGAFLLRRAAGAWGRLAFPAISDDLLVLADLFAAHEATYPELDLRGAA